MHKGFSRSKLFKYREKTHQRYPEIWDLKILRKRFPIILETLRDYEPLNTGGRLIPTTSNIFNPGRFRRDATHRVAYCYDELGGILFAQGFHIKAIYRTYNDVFYHYLLRVYVMAPLHRDLGIHFAKSILVVDGKR